MNDMVTEVAVRGRSFILSDDEDVADLKQRIQDAARSRQFVDFIAHGCTVSVLIAPGSDVIITSETTAELQADELYPPSLEDDFDF